MAKISKKNYVLIDSRNDLQIVYRYLLDEAQRKGVTLDELKSALSDITGEANSQRMKTVSRQFQSDTAKSGPSRDELILKAGHVVEPDSGLVENAHVYIYNEDRYNSVLTSTDIQEEKNSFYKLQLLESDDRNKYWVYRAWGRINTSIGGHKLEQMDSIEGAISKFCDLFEKKTGNQWQNRHNFTKVPGKKYLLDIQYNKDPKNIKIDTADPLPEPVQELMKLIFDINSMEKVMLNFELDIKKMPLGQLNKKLIQNAFLILRELEYLVSTKGSVGKILDASNRFYTSIPHSFGLHNAPLINKLQMIKEKTDMLISLLELEIAYTLMRSRGWDRGIYAFYDKLETDILVLDRRSKEFLVIEEYVKNTHAPTHDHFGLDVIYVFQIKRQGEEERHEPFKSLRNRKLLCHGSHRHNFAGILSQGLRIAPPEAPTIGQRFGTGIYFADMVSKAAQYSCAYEVNDIGLVLLCEVALGEMLEIAEPQYIEELPLGKHSCKGIGKWHPDPNKIEKLGEADVPVGEAVLQNVGKCWQLQNEYVVYDVAQVKMKYLVQLKVINEF